jgi:hypothetical protein
MEFSLEAGDFDMTCLIVMMWIGLGVAVLWFVLRERES